VQLRYALTVLLYTRRNPFIPIFIYILVRLVPLPILQCTVNVSLRGLFGSHCPLIIELFTLAQADLQFGAALDNIQLQGNDRQPLLLAVCSQAEDLFLMQQQPLTAHRVPVENIAVVVRGNMHPHGVHLALVNAAPAVFQIHFALANGLNLRAEKLQSRLVGVQHKIVVERFFVAGNHLLCFSQSAHSFLSLLNQAAPLQGSGQGDLVGILQICAHRNAVGQSADSNAHGFQQPADIHSGGLALYGRIGGHNNLLHRAVVQSRQQLLNADLVRTDIVHRRDGAVEYMVGAVILVGALNGGHIPRILHADHAFVPGRVFADGAKLLLRQIAADLALVDLGVGFGNGVGKSPGFFV